LMASGRLDLRQHMRARYETTQLENMCTCRQFGSVACAATVPLRRGNGTRQQGASPRVRGDEASNNNTTRCHSGCSSSSIARQRPVAHGRPGRWPVAGTVASNTTVRWGSSIVASSAQATARPRMALTGQHAAARVHTSGQTWRQRAPERGDRVHPANQPR